jgi:large subunit ribosomal protein L24
VCTRCDYPVRIGKKVLENGKKVRVCRRCGDIVGQAT